MLQNAQSKEQRDEVMKKLFDPKEGIGITMLRQPIGLSDQNAPGENVPYTHCSYNDNSGIPDESLANFSIERDISTHTIELLQQARQLNPELKILAVPWCIPQ